MVQAEKYKAITEETSADIDIQDDGTVYVFGDTKEQVKKH